VSRDEDKAGARIARARRRRGLSQLVLAGLVDRSESWLSQVERGKRGVDSYVVLTRMAEVLRVEVEELTGPGGGDGEEGQRVYEPAAEIEQAMIGYEAVSASIGGREPGAKATAAHLQARASAAYAGYQATRYDDTGRMLPALIREAEAAGGDDQEACSVRVLVYDTTAALLHRVGETSLAWTAADRALAAAEQSGRPELMALQAYRLTYVIADRKHPAEALGAGVDLPGPDSPHLDRVRPALTRPQVPRRAVRRRILPAGPVPRHPQPPARTGGPGRQDDDHNSELKRGRSRVHRQVSRSHQCAG
jgi:transcriptional regulator with XRE-family HTH domain